MTKIKKFRGFSITGIAGGKDPVRLVEEFILRQGFDPDACRQDASPDSARWMLDLEDAEQLEVLTEGIKKPNETTIYLGINAAIVPLRNTQEFLVTALEIADGLVGIKISLVGHYLVLSASLALVDLSTDELDYHYKLITAQKDWFKNTLASELAVSELGEGDE